MKEALKLARGILCAPYHDVPLDDVLEAIDKALAQPTSGDYALGYAEGFNDACKKPEQEPVEWPEEHLKFLNFLYGAGEFEGVWFEQKHQTEKGTFWWRKHLRRLFDAPLQPKKQEQEPVALNEYDAGLLNDYGGGNVEWWQDYIRAELGRAYEHYQSQITTPLQRKPLTDEMRKQMKDRCDSMEMRGAFADGWISAEAAHGIKE